MFYFFFQLIRNRIPIRNAIPEICTAQDSLYHSNGFCINTAIYNSPARIKAIPPTISYFHEIIRIIVRIIEGILCMNNPRIVPQKDNFMSNMSRLKRLRKSMKIIASIRGAQYTNLLIFFVLVMLILKIH